ncbi:MAG: hypothetical protein AAF485_27505, partial [Chloroflexota bacterium]
MSDLNILNNSNGKPVDLPDGAWPVPEMGLCFVIKGRAYRVTKCPKCQANVVNIRDVRGDQLS